MEGIFRTTGVLRGVGLSAVSVHYDVCVYFTCLTSVVFILMLYFTKVFVKSALTFMYDLCDVAVTHYLIGTCFFVCMHRILLVFVLLLASSLLFSFIFPQSLFWLQFNKNPKHRYCSITRVCSRRDLTAAYGNAVIFFSVWKWPKYCRLKSYFKIRLFGKTHLNYQSHLLELNLCMSFQFKFSPNDINKQASKQINK